MLLGKDRTFSFTFENGCPENCLAHDVVPCNLATYIYSNKKVTSDFHGTVSINPVKMSQQK